MSEKKDTTESLKLEDAQIERLRISLKQKMHNCPRCKDETNHDDRFKTVKDLSICGKPLKLQYRRHKYFCPIGGKKGFRRLFIS